MTPSTHKTSAALVLAWASALFVCMAGAVGWIDAGPTMALSIQAVALASAPIVVGLSALLSRGTRTRALPTWPLAANPLLHALLVLNVSLSMSLWAADEIGVPGPAIHDEHSYLLQARTFMEGRLWRDAHPALPEIFDQVHVLNEKGRCFSRYPPGTALFLVPSLIAGNPVLGNWCVNVLTSLLVLAIGREVGGSWTGLMAGLLAAISPGLAIFGNLVLAHQPTLLGLSVALWSWVVLGRTRRLRWALLCGSGLAWAFCCRPLTAAAWALPLAAWCVAGISLAWRDARERKQRLFALLAIGTPVILAVLLVGEYNRQLTGSPFVTPWDRYNQVYTPSHRYGFDNAINGRLAVAPRRLAAYDEWAANLDGTRAFQNGLKRLLGSWNGSAGVATSCLVLVLATATFRTLSTCSRMCLCLIAMQHAVYLPYWFSGISGWHYVVETVPLWGILVADQVTRQCRLWMARRAFAAVFATVILVLVCQATAFVPDSGSDPSSFKAALRWIRGMRLRRESFQELVAGRIAERPALVLVVQPTNDIHSDFVVNECDWTARVLHGRYDPSRISVDEIQKAFPRRELWVFDQEGWELTRARPSAVLPGE